jgi:hypothetical protein
MGALLLVVGLFAAGTTAEVLASATGDLLDRPGRERAVVSKLPGRLEHCPRGYVLSVQSGGDTVLRRRIALDGSTGPLCGSAFRWLRVGRLTGRAQDDVAVNLLVTPSIGEETHVLRTTAAGFRLVRVFNADRIRAVDRSGDGRPEIVLSWLYPGRSPSGSSAEEVWRWERGAFRLWRVRRG